MNAIIITIGDEILVGQTIDTNSAHIATEINKIGIPIDEIVSISDTAKHIKETLDRTLPLADILILTGGLGPTNDDITKHVLTDYFEDELVIYPEVLSRIQTLFKKINKPFLEVNRAQAMLPKMARILENDLGTASGMWFTKNGKHVLSMPGVPYEMKGLLRKFIKEIKELIPEGNFYHNTLQVTGIGESYLAELIKDWEQKNLDAGITVSYLPSIGNLKLRLTGTRDQKEMIDAHIEELLTAYPKYIIGGEFDTLEKVIAQLLFDNNVTLGTVESCTGGSVAKKLVSMSGSSAYYMGSIISYTNDLKEKLVGVKKQTLIDNGAVSEPVVREMAKNGKEKLGVDYCISISGIAGPSGGSAEKPVGTIWIGLASPDKVFAKKFSFGHSRNRNIRATVYAALNFLRLVITKQIN